MAWARELADALLNHFEDTEQGGFFFTSHDHEALITRPKPGYDNATPSGNGVAAFALQRLGHLLGETRYLEASMRCLRVFQAQLIQQPIAYPTLLAVLDESLVPTRVIVLRGPQAALREWSAKLVPQLGVRDMLLALPNGTDCPEARAPLSLFYGVVFALLGYGLVHGAWRQAASGDGADLRLPVCRAGAGHGVLLRQPPPGAKPQAAQSVGPLLSWRANPVSLGLFALMLVFILIWERISAILVGLFLEWFRHRQPVRP